MANETNLFGTRIESWHEGRRVGPIYNMMCKTRYKTTIRAIEMVEASLGRQISTAHVIYQQKPTNQPTQAAVTHVETYHNESNARLAVDNAVNVGDNNAKERT